MRLANRYGPVMVHMCEILLDDQPLRVGRVGGGGGERAFHESGQFHPFSLYIFKKREGELV